jgi:competence protein ComEC
MGLRVVYAIVAGFVLGVFVASAYSSSWLVPSIAMAFAALCLGLFFKKYGRYLFLIAIVFCTAVLGMLRMDGASMQHDQNLAAQLDQKVTLVGTVVREPDERERSVRLTVDLHEHDARVLAIVPPHTIANYGDIVELEGTLRSPQSFDAGDGRVFNYPKFLEGRGISYELAFAGSRVVKEGTGNPIVAAALFIKQSYLRGIRIVLPEPHAGLAGGITVGDKRSVGQDLTEVFTSVSLVHILVLSGYNITIVLTAIAKAITGISRRTQLLITAAVVVFFALISGGASTALRAGAMAYLGVYARLSGRQFFALRALFFVAFCMVLWNPYVLVFDPGFQLSILATAGLILLTSPISDRLTRIPEKFGIREIVASSIATQLFVLPLLLYQNGVFSIVSIPANLLALIAVPLAMVFSAVAAIAGILLGSWGVLVAFPAYVLLSYIILIAEWFASIPGAALSVPAFSSWWLIPAYMIIALLVWLLHTKTAPTDIGAVRTKQT